jgi:prevent-host-death family protein
MNPENIPISKFKATCLELLRKVKLTRQPLVITRNNEPIAMVVPPPDVSNDKTWLGSFQESGEIVGDIIAPVLDENEWSVLK